jgi:hypothetical protein
MLGAADADAHVVDRIAVEVEDELVEIARRDVRSLHLRAKRLAAWCVVDPEVDLVAERVDVGQRRVDDLAPEAQVVLAGLLVETGFVRREARGDEHQERQSEGQTSGHAYIYAHPGPPIAD